MSDDKKNPPKVEFVPDTTLNFNRTAPNKFVFDKKVIDSIYAMAKIRLRIDQMAAILGIGKRTLERARHDNPLVDDAINRGRAEAAMVVAHKAYEMAASGQNPEMTRFWLKAQEGWKERNVIEHTGEDGGAVRFESEAEHRAYIKELMEKCKLIDG